jgi:hypothetical protein
VYSSNPFVIDTQAPTIEHTPPDEAYAGTQLSIDAELKDNFNIASAILYYKTPDQSIYGYNAMILTGNEYTSSIMPQSAGVIEYYIETSDGANTATTEIFNVEVKDLRPSSTPSDESDKSNHLVLIGGLVALIIITLLMLRSYIRRKRENEIKELKALYEETAETSDDSPKEIDETESEDEIKVEKYQGYL